MERRMIKGGESVSDVSGVFYPLFIVRIILLRDFFSALAHGLRRHCEKKERELIKDSNKLENNYKRNHRELLIL